MSDFTCKELEIILQGLNLKISDLEYTLNYNCDNKEYEGFKRQQLKNTREVRKKVIGYIKTQRLTNNLTENN